MTAVIVAWSLTSHWKGLGSTQQLLSAITAQAYVQISSPYQPSLRLFYIGS